MMTPETTNMEKEGDEKHIEELDEKIQRADMGSETLGEQHKNVLF